MEILDLKGPEFLALYLLLLLVAVTGSAVLLYMLRAAGREWSPDDPYDLAFLRGGYRGVLEAATARLMHVKALKLDGDAQHAKLVRADAVTPNGKVEQAVLAWAALDSNALESGEAAVRSAMRGREDALVERGVLASESERWGNYLLACIPTGALTLLGVVKIGIGLERNRPVGFLVLMVVGTLVLMGAAALVRPKLTRAGAKALDATKAENNALRYAGTGGSLGHLDSRDVLLSVALFGMAPLIGTELGPVHRYFAPPQSTGGSSCGGSSCGGGGGCGGGCGGCGG